VRAGQRGQVTAAQVNAAFRAMRDADMALDDYDLATASPKYEEAMRLARLHNELLATFEDQQAEDRRAGRQRERVR
jgi:hypothetical protein